MVSSRISGNRESCDFYSWRELGIYVSNLGAVVLELEANFIFCCFLVKYWGEILEF